MVVEALDEDNRSRERAAPLQKLGVGPESPGDEAMPAVSTTTHGHQGPVKFLRGSAGTLGSPDVEDHLGGGMEDLPKHRKAVKA